MGLTYIRKLHHDNKIHISKIHFNASDNPFLNQACIQPPSSYFTLVFEEGRCYIYSYFLLFYYCRYIVHYAILLNHFLVVALLLQIYAIKSAMASLTDEYLIVTAIDFGTTYSGYAFSSIDDFKNDPLIIVGNQEWPRD